MVVFLGCHRDILAMASGSVRVVLQALYNFERMSVDEGHRGRKVKVLVWYKVFLKVFFSEYPCQLISGEWWIGRVFRYVAELNHDFFSPPPSMTASR